MVKCSVELMTHLHLNQSTGVLALNRSLDHEHCAKYSYVVRASDALEHRLSALLTLRLHVSDVNDNPTRFVQSKYLFQVAENAPLESEQIKMQMNITDPDDVRSPLTFSIESDEVKDEVELRETFEVREATSNGDGHLAALLIIRKPLDYELRRRYFFRVVLTDERLFTDSTLVEVNATL